MKNKIKPPNVTVPQKTPEEQTEKFIYYQNPKATILSQNKQKNHSISKNYSNMAYNWVDVTPTVVSYKQHIYSSNVVNCRHVNTRETSPLKYEKAPKEIPFYDKPKKSEKHRDKNKSKGIIDNDELIVFLKELLEVLTDDEAPSSSENLRDEIPVKKKDTVVNVQPSESDTYKSLLSSNESWLNKYFDSAYDLENDENDEEDYDGFNDDTSNLKVVPSDSFERIRAKLIRKQILNDDSFADDKSHHSDGSKKSHHSDGSKKSRATNLTKVSFLKKPYSKIFQNYPIVNAMRTSNGFLKTHSSKLKDSVDFIDMTPEWSVFVKKPKPKKKVNILRKNVMFIKTINASKKGKKSKSKSKNAKYRMMKAFERQLQFTGSTKTEFYRGLKSLAKFKKKMSSMRKA